MKIFHKIASLTIAFVLMVSLLPMAIINADATSYVTDSTNSRISFVSIEQAAIEEGQSQTVVVGVNCEELENLSLTYINNTSQEEDSVEASDYADSAYSFIIDCSAGSEAAEYQLVSLSYTYEGNDYIESFDDLGIEAKWGVNQVVDTDPDAIAADQETFDSVDAALETATTEVTTFTKSASASTSSSSNVVVVLDPGHGGSDSGACYNGLKEKVLNLKIAKYCREELEQYAGVTVYMTRTSDKYVSLDDRTTYAKKVGADAFVSIHLNAASASASGVEVYYPNSHYKSSIGKKGKALASSVQKSLVSLGISDRGIKVRNCVYDTYSDGSKADYYSVIRTSKKKGFPGIIIEHCFISNKTEANKYLKTNSGLKSLGVADATGIANYFGLSKISSAVFSASFYWSKYETELTEEGYTSESSYSDLYAEYISTGAALGRDASPVFNAKYYYDNNACVRKNFSKSDSSINWQGLVNNFSKYGMKKGRASISSFNLQSYKNRYRSLRKAYGNKNVKYYEHYASTGYYNGYEATGYEKQVVNYRTKYKGVDYSAVYDMNYYLAKYPGLLKKYGYDEGAVLKNFVKVGMKKGRKASANFSPRVYRKNYKKLRIKYKKNWKKYYLNYIKYGKKKGRIAV